MQLSRSQRTYFTTLDLTVLFKVRSVKTTIDVILCEISNCFRSIWIVACLVDNAFLHCVMTWTPLPITLINHNKDTITYSMLRTWRATLYFGMIKVV